MALADDACGNCQFWEAFRLPDMPALMIGECRWLPRVERKFAAEHCGQHKRKDPAAGQAPEPAKPTTESDDDLRLRIFQVAGSHTVNQSRIQTAVGPALDEVAAIYEVKRK